LNHDWLVEQLARGDIPASFLLFFSSFPFYVLCPLHWSSSSHQLVCFWLRERPRPFVEASFESSKSVGSRWRLRFLDQDPSLISSIAVTSDLSLAVSSHAIYILAIIRRFQAWRTVWITWLRSRVNKHRARLLSRPTTLAGCRLRSPCLDQADQGPSGPRQV